MALETNFPCAVCRLGPFECQCDPTCVGVEIAGQTGAAATKDGQLITREEMYMHYSPAIPDALDDFFADCRRGDGRSLQRELDTANAQVRLREGTIERQHKALLEAQEREIALRTELMAAHDRLAAFTAVNVLYPSKPAVLHAIRPLGDADRRRVGG